MQLGLGLSIPATRCLTTAETLRDLLRITHDEVMAAVDSGVVPYAFDLRTPGADRLEIRIWHPSAEALVKSGGKDSGPRIPTDDLLHHLVPGHDVRSSNLERWWTVSHQHIHALIKAGSLPVRRAPSVRLGPHSFFLLAADGLRTFLRTRLISAPIGNSPQ